MINIIVNGSKGNMGSEVVKTIASHSVFNLVAESDLGDNLLDKIQNLKPDIVIDFTHPSCVYKNTIDILNGGAYAIIGTTGLLEENLTSIKDLCEKKKLSCLIAPNFCIGAVLMMKFSKIASNYMKNIEIIEYHHDKKADAPSGTAIKTAQMICNENQDLKLPEIESKEILPLRSQGAMIGNIKLHSVRLPGFIASQDVIFGSLGETLKISHQTVNRESFMSGVLLACDKITKLSKKTLYYGLESLMND